MECPLTWIFVAIITYLSLIDKVSCQNVGPGNVMVRDNREFIKPPGNPSPTDMFNSLLTVAASNGVLPDLIPVLQGQPVVDNLQRCPYTPEMLTKPLSVVPMPCPSITGQEPVFFSSPPVRPPPSLNQNVVVTPITCGSTCPSNVIPATPQTISPPVLPPSNCVSQIAQALPLENYPTCPQNAGVVRPTPIVLQPQCQFNEVNPYNFYNQISEPILMPEVNVQPINLPILPPPQILPPINTCSGQLEITPNLGSTCIPQPIFTNDGQSPLSLQINVPTPSVPAPRITVVAANPPNSPVPASAPFCPSPFCTTPFCSDCSSNFPAVQYSPQPPIILGGNSKSSLQNWLPIILVALFSDRGNNAGCGCCRCCCSCNGGSGNNIPIPYPIPIPVNNPIINTCPYPYSSRNRECRDYGDDDDDFKR